MSRRTLVRRLLHAVLPLSLLVTASCDDNPGPHAGDLWQEATLVDAPAHGALFSLAFSGSRGLAAGVGVSGSSSAPVNSPYLAARMDNNTWARPAGVPLSAGSILSAVGFAPTGEALVAGVSSDSQTGFILDERSGWSSHTFPGFGGMVFATALQVVRVGGYSLNSMAVLRSDGPDVWTPESLPFSGQGEHGITDMSADSGLFFACGFDDGGDGSPGSPNNVLFRNDGSGWVRADVPCGGCSNREFKAVAVTPSGGVFLGGAVTDFSAGSPDQYQAFLLLRTATGSWLEIVLPEPGVLDRVNDILIATDGTIYLACGVTGSFILRSASDGTAVREATLPTARLAALAEAPDRSIWAAGAVNDTAGEPSRPAIWRR